MREMKDSGVSWVGKIPADWEIVPLKSLFSYYKGLPITKADLTETGIPIISYGQIHSKMNRGTHVTPDLIRFVPDKYLHENPQSLAQKGDILFADTSEDYSGIGNCVLVDVDSPLFAGYHTIIARPQDGRHSKYLAYLFQTDNWRSQLRFQASGIKVYSVTQKMLKTLSIVLPPVKIGERIVAYLDTKCAKIDAIIARQQQVIEKLKAYKLSVITEAVTKGLNPDVPMKDSGIEWIGLVPKHWIVSTLRNGLLDIQTGPFGSQLHAADYIENGIFVVNPANIVNGVIIPDSRCSISDEKAHELEQHILIPGDVVFARRGEMGRCACIPTDTNRYFCGTGCIRLKCNAIVNPQFATDYLQMPYVKQYLELHSVGTTMSNLNSHIIAGIPMLFPPVTEQEAIHAFISDKSEAINGQTKKKMLLIDKLTEYKKSLIYEVVTGKREINADSSDTL